MTFALAGLIQGCSTESDPSAKEKIKAKLINTTWTLQEVTVDGVIKTSIYEGLTLRFTETSYTTSNGGAM